MNAASRQQPTRRGGRFSRGVSAVLASFVAAALTACKGGIVHELIEYATTPCPFGTEQVISTETGTPGLKKLTEKWCETKDAKGERIRHGPYVEIYESGAKEIVGRYRDGRRDGTWTRWHPNGRVDAITVYGDGKPQ